jgi:hypothetical protein
MNEHQMSAVRKVVQNQEELQAAYDSARPYKYGKNKVWMVFLVVTKVKGEQRWEWVVHLRLYNKLKKKLKEPKQWDEQEWAQARKMAVSELDGVGRIVSSGEVQGSDFIMMTRDLTVDESLLIQNPETLGH